MEDRSPSGNEVQTVLYQIIPRKKITCWLRRSRFLDCFKKLTQVCHATVLPMEWEEGTGCILWTLLRQTNEIGNAVSNSWKDFLHLLMFGKPLQGKVVQLLCIRLWDDYECWSHSNCCNHWIHRRKSVDWNWHLLLGRIN